MSGTLKIKSVRGQKGRENKILATKKPTEEQKPLAVVVPITKNQLPEKGSVSRFALQEQSLKQQEKPSVNMATEEPSTLADLQPKTHFGFGSMMANYRRITGPDADKW